MDIRVPPMAGINQKNEERLQDILQSPGAWISFGLHNYGCISGGEYTNVGLVEDTV